MYLLISVSTSSGSNDTPELSSVFFKKSIETRAMPTMMIKDHFDMEGAISATSGAKMVTILETTLQTPNDVATATSGNSF